MHEKEKDRTIPFIQYEAALAHEGRRIKVMCDLIIILLFALVATNAYWIIKYVI